MRVAWRDLHARRTQPGDLPRPALRILLGAGDRSDGDLARALERFGEHARRIGMRAEADQHIEEQHGYRRIGERRRDRLVAQLGLEHRMRPAARVAIVAEVDAIAARVGAPQDEFSLARQRAAAVEAAYRAGLLWQRRG